MELKIISSTDNKLLKRKHCDVQLSFPGEKTPSNKDVTAAIAKATGAAEDAVAVRNIAAPFGSTTGKVDAYVYESKAQLDKVEARPKAKAKTEKKA